MSYDRNSFYVIKIQHFQNFTFLKFLHFQNVTYFKIPHFQISTFLIFQDIKKAFDQLMADRFVHSSLVDLSEHDIIVSSRSRSSRQKAPAGATDFGQIRDKLAKYRSLADMLLDAAVVCDRAESIFQVNFSL